jgi:transposase
VQRASYSTINIRRLAIEAIQNGMPIGQLSVAYGVDRTTLFRWYQRFRTKGESGLERLPGSGRPREHQEMDAEKLLKIIVQPATHFGFETELWTVGRLKRVLNDEFKVSFSKNTVWRRLREAGLTYQKPEREYFEVDHQARHIWLKREVPKIRKMVKKYKAILYFQDESNISLTAFLGKTWSPCGKTPKARVTGKRGGVAAMSALNPQGRLLFRLHDKRISSLEVIQFLRQMLKHHPRRHLVVVMDQAPPHTSKQTQEFIKQQKRLHVFHLPKYSPDWNPDEKVWNHLKHQELKSHQAKTKQELTGLTRRKLNRMAKDPELIRGLFFRCCVADFFE